MKTTTILDAWDEASTRYHNLCAWRESGKADVEDRVIEKRRRQSQMFQNYLICRIEQGDRARAKLLEIDKLMEVANTNYHGLYMDIEEIISGETE